MIPFEFYREIFSKAQALIKSAPGDLVQCHDVRDRKEDLERILSRRTSSGLSLEDSSSLLSYFSPNGLASTLEVLRCAAREVRIRNFGSSCSIMVPVEYSSFCSSNCSFCSWRSSNREILRLKSSKALFEEEVRCLVKRGFQHIELAAGDDLAFIRRDLPAALKIIRDVSRELKSPIRTSICLTPFPEWLYRDLKTQGLADGVLTWQETYDQARFEEVILSGPKRFGLNETLELDPGVSGFFNRLTSQERAVRAGLQVGIGTMIGLSTDFRADVLAALLHAKKLIETYAETIEPVIMGLPAICSTNGEASSVRGHLPAGMSMDDAVEFVAYFYLLCLPDRKAWIFANGRVSPECQLRIIENASNFTSSEVVLTPGAYQPVEKGGLRAAQSYAARGKTGQSDLLGVEELLRGEQFRHSVVSHEDFVQELQVRGIQPCSEQEFLGPEKDFVGVG